MPSVPQIILLVIAVVLTLLFWTSLFSISPPKPISSPTSPPSTPPIFRQRLVAVGDLHGDIDHAKKVFRMAKILDVETESWIAGTDILVQTGDIVDRGTWAIDIYQLMRELRSQASGVGGQVISILGNHEVMNAIGDWRYVSQADIKRFGSTEQRQHDLSSEGWLGQEWLANYSVTALVPLSPYSSAPLLSFTHGSLRPSYPNLTPYPSAINEIGQSFLTRALTPPLAPPYPPNPYAGLPKGTTKEEAELYAAGGPLWWRGLAEVQDEQTVCTWAEELKQKIGVRRVIGGHTPDFEKIVDRCNASIIIIDTGISYVYGGVLSALEITYTIHPFTPEPDHRQDPLLGDEAADLELREGHQYIEREEVYAIYERGKKLITIEQNVIKL